MKLSAPPLSSVRTLLFGAMALVWLSEMVFLGFQSFSKVWTQLWQVIPPENPQLVTALYITWAVSAPAKGALWAMAVFGLRSSNPSARTALFVSMALVPPLNLAFPFRQQGFLVKPVAVAAILSTILWGAFFLFRERAQQPEREAPNGSGPLPPSRRQWFQDGWFAASSAALTIMALLSLFWPRTALRLILPCLSGVLSADAGGLPSLIHTTLASGTHLLAVATASWIATVHGRSNPALRRAVTVACSVQAGLFLLFPLRQIVLDFGRHCATASILILFVPLFLGWLVYAALSHTMEPARPAPLP